MAMPATAYRPLALAAGAPGSFGKIEGDALAVPWERLPVLLLVSLALRLEQKQAQFSV
jgi:hypothetical protein